MDRSGSKGSKGTKPGFVKSSLTPRSPPQASAPASSFTFTPPPASGHKLTETTTKETPQGSQHDSNTRSQQASEAAPTFMFTSPSASGSLVTGYAETTMDTPQGSQPSKKRKEISPLAADRHIDLAMFMLKEVTAMVSSLTSTSSDPAIVEQTKQITHKLGWITASIERTDYMRDLLHESDHRENEILVEQNRDLREQAQTAQGLQTDLIESLHRENELLIEQNRSLRDLLTPNSS